MLHWLCYGHAVVKPPAVLAVEVGHVEHGVVDGAVLVVNEAHIVSVVGVVAVVVIVVGARGWWF